jgi:hemoglobin
MGVTAAEFDALVGDLVETLDKFGVGEAEKTELLNALAPMRPDIVEIETEETGTRLPDGYQNAPGLAHA